MLKLQTRLKFKFKLEKNNQLQEIGQSFKIRIQQKLEGTVATKEAS